jgi:hypothetical protein
MFPDPNIGARTSYHDTYAAGENPPAFRVESAPGMMSYGASTLSHYHASIASYFPEFYAPLQSADGVSTMPDSEDVMPLHAGQPLPLDQPLCFDAPRLGSPLPAGEACRSQPSRKRRQGDLFIPFDPHQKKIRGWAAAKVSAYINNTLPKANGVTGCFECCGIVYVVLQAPRCCV